MKDEILMTVQASPPRRSMGIGMLGFLAVLLLYLAARSPAEGIVLMVFLVAAGLGALALSVRMYRATQVHLHLTPAGLHSSDGRIIAPIGQIASLDRGMFAYKPSNGFLLRLTEAAPSAWEPGMWWRFGSRVGVGGVVSGGQTKAMAEMISALMAERDAA